MSVAVTLAGDGVRARQVTPRSTQWSSTGAAGSHHVDLGAGGGPSVGAGGGAANAAIAKSTAKKAARRTA